MVRVNMGERAAQRTCICQLFLEKHELATDPRPADEGVLRVELGAGREAHAGVRVK